MKEEDPQLTELPEFRVLDLAPTSGRLSMRGVVWWSHFHPVQLLWYMEWKRSIVQSSMASL